MLFIMNRSVYGSRAFRKWRLWYQGGCFFIWSNSTRGKPLFILGVNVFLKAIPLCLPLFFYCLHFKVQLHEFICSSSRFVYEIYWFVLMVLFYFCFLVWKDSHATNATGNSDQDNILALSTTRKNVFGSYWLSLI